MPLLASLPWILALLACSGEVEPPAPAPPAANVLPVTPPPPLASFVGQPTGLRIRDLVLHADGGTVEVAYLIGRLRPRGQFVDLEDPTTFEVDVHALELRIPEQSLETAIRGPDGTESPLRELTVRTEGDAFVLEGHTRFLNLPFTFRAHPRVTTDGKLALELEKVRVLGFGLRGFLDLFQEPVEDAVNKKEHRRLLTVEKDLLIIDPFPFAGPPEVHAAFTSVEVHPGGLVARLGEAPPPESYPQGVSLVGGVLRTGNTILFDNTVSLVSLHENGPLVLDPARLDGQITAGFSKIRGNTVVLHLVPPEETPPD